MLNKIMLIGRLGADPTINYMPNGKAVANINLATSLNWKDKQTGERKESTEWHRVVLFERLAEVVGEYLKKGGLVYIEGRLQTRKWQDKDGKDCYTTEIVASEMKMLGSKDNQSTADSPSKSNQNTAKSSTPNYPHYAPPPNYINYNDDDVPF